MDQCQSIPVPSDWCEGRDEEEEESSTAEPSVYSQAFRDGIQALSDSSNHCTQPMILSLLDRLKVQLEDGRYLSSSNSATAPLLLELVATVWDRPLPTLYVGRVDLELVGVLRRTVENATLAVQQVGHTVIAPSGYQATASALE